MGPGRLDHFAIQVTPFDEAAIRAHLAAHDVAITDSGRRYGAEGDGPSIYIQDPDGKYCRAQGPGRLKPLLLRSDRGQLLV